MATRMQQRRGTAEQWEAANPVLAAGEIGFETDTSQFKVGDGVNQWEDLSYFKNVEDLGLEGSLDDYILKSSAGVALGVASLDADGKVPSSQLPDIDELSQDAINDALTEGTGITKDYNDAANTLTLSVDTDVIATKEYVDDEIAAIPATDLTDYATKTYADTAASVAAAALVDSAPETLDTLNELAAALGDDPNFATTVANSIATKAPIESPTFTGTVSGVTKAHVGLGNVDNTSDANKPVSSATQTALDLKAPIANPTFTGTVSGVTKSMVGLGNVDNTSDANKPVSTATQTALNGKANTSHTHAIGDVTNLQTSLDAKANLAGPTFTGTVVLPSTTSIGNVSATELGFVDGVTSAIQTQLDGKAALSHSHNGSAITYVIEDKTANYTIVAADEGKIIRSTGSAITVTVADVFAVGEVVTFAQYGAGQITFAPAGGVTLHSVDTKRKTNKQYSTVQIVKTAAATYLLFGDIVA